MVPTLGIAEAITNLKDIREKFDLSRSNDPLFFRKWIEHLPDLTESEKEILDRLQNRYFYYADEGSITEGTIEIVAIAPLLEVLEFCDPPFKIRSEQAVRVEVEDRETPLQGFIDALVVQEQLWVVVIEAKRYGFNVSFAIPQTLAYMMGNSNLEQPTFGMATNGEDYIFIKLDRQGKQYDLSDKLTLSTRRQNELYEVVRIMKRIKEDLLG
ncbi:MAG: type I restriction endonuclease [Cyanobacteriota bacterium]|nr:type I restriction endonuclease [Cyanobacteriota bacterium]